MGRFRYFASVSVFGFLVGFYKSRFGIRYRFLKISDIGSVCRLSNPCLKLYPVNPAVVNNNCVPRPIRPIDNENAFHNYLGDETIKHL